MLVKDIIDARWASWYDDPIRITFDSPKLQDSFNLASLRGIYDIHPVRKVIIDVVQSRMLAEGFTRLQRVLVTQRSHFVLAM